MTRKMYADVMTEHRARLDRVAERGGVKRLKNLYDRAQEEMAEKLRKLAAGGLSDSFTGHQANVISEQITQGQRKIATLMGDELGDASHNAQKEALHGLAQDVTRLDKHYTGRETVLPVEEASRFFKVIDNSRAGLLDMHQTSMDVYGDTLVTKMHEELGLSLATGEDTNKAIDRVQDVAKNEWWQAERITRTEIAAAFSQTAKDGMQEAAKELPDLMMRWTEAVDDQTGEPLDDRVAPDSIAMHGQLAPPGGQFTMPPDPDVSEKMWGKSWDAPPNRPNDRAALAPWRPDWGIPGWVWEGGKRKWIVDQDGNLAPEFKRPALPEAKPTEERPRPETPKPERAAPETPHEMHEHLKREAPTLFGAPLHNKSIEVVDTEDGALASREFNGAMLISPDTHALLEEAIARGKAGLPATEEHAEAISTLVHEELHGLGEWKRPTTLAGDFEKTLKTSAGKAIEEGAVELQAVLKFRDAAKALGINVPADVGPRRGYEVRSVNGRPEHLWGNHSYPNEVANVETLAHWGAGTNKKTIQKNGPLGPGGMSVLDGLLHAWKPSERVAEVSKRIAAAQGRPELAPQVEEAVKANFGTKFTDREHGKATDLHRDLTAVFKKKP